MYTVNIPMLMVFFGMYLCSVLMIFILHMLGSKQMHNFWAVGRYELIVLEVLASALISLIWPALALLDYFTSLVPREPVLRPIQVVDTPVVPAADREATMVASQSQEGEFRHTSTASLTAG